MNVEMTFTCTPQVDVEASRKTGFTHYKRETIDHRLTIQGIAPDGKPFTITAKDWVAS